MKPGDLLQEGPGSGRGLPSPAEERKATGGLRGFLRARHLFLAALLLLAVGLFWVGGRMTRPEFCASCHEMAPEVVSWQLSTHRQVACTECHLSPDPKGFVLDALGAIRQVYRHFSRSWPKEFKIEHPVENSLCEKCHTIRREVTASGDLKVPHQKHISEYQTACVDCHSTVAHGGITQKIVEKGFPRIVEPGSVRATDAAGISSVEAAPPGASSAETIYHLQAADYRPKMGECMNCHNGKRAPYSCGLCHKGIKTPANHLVPAWSTEHGRAAREDLSKCLLCHALALGKGLPPKGTPVVAAIRGNDFCSNCHSERPPSHDGTWSLNHKTAAGPGPEGCLVCHADKSADQRAPARTYCAQCHENGHGEDWLRVHPKTVKKEGAAKCFRCHDSRHCALCHTGTR
ncbi:MAG: NapC/NirT family cytochrome c [Firmicutes bacterium]|nr:NapC/NirT family cytochrome c [Bacillota bacterium]MCL5040756.1 NapC/NirT family cytochrome c [Bacillota bacterium]